MNRAFLILLALLLLGVGVRGQAQALKSGVHDRAPIVVPPEETKDGGRTGAGRPTPGIAGLVLISAGVLVAFWLLGWIIRRMMQFVEGSRTVPPGATAPPPGPGPDGSRPAPEPGGPTAPAGPDHSEPPAAPPPPFP